jgi:hypothetical protein
MKEIFHPSDFESVVNPLIHAHQPQTAPIFLSRDIGADERSNPRRIRQWDIREVEDERARVVGAQLGLKAEYIEKGQRSRKVQDADSLPRPGKIIDLQRLIGHARNVNGE